MKAAVIQAATQEVLQRTSGHPKEGEPEGSAAVVIDADRLLGWRAEMSAGAQKKSLATVHLLVKQCDQCGRRHAAMKLNVVSLDKQTQSNDLASVYIEVDSPVEPDVGSESG